MIRPRFIFAVSFLAMFVATDYALGAIASSGYVDQQVDTRLSSISGTTTGDGNVVTEISASGDTITATKGINAEVISNKVTAVGTTDTANDTKYPSELAVAKALDEKQDKLEGEVLTNTATGTSSFSTGEATPATSTASVAIGDGSTVSGDKAVAVGTNANAASSSVAVGASAFGEASQSVVIGEGSGVLGGSSSGGVALGANSAARGNGPIAIGKDTFADGNFAIQIGVGINSEDSTLSVGLSDSNNYKLLNSDGTIPAERMPDTVLTNTATAGNAFSTSISTPAGFNGGTVLGSTASVSGVNSTALGIASNANTRSVAVGGNANASGADATAVGFSSIASGDTSVALGELAEATSANSIQIGQGTNNEANTFKVSLGSSSSNNYKLLGSDGKIPVERLPAARIPVGSSSSPTSYATFWIQ